jgi:hypothetical protein
MKIISWNKGCGFDTGGYRSHHEAALAWLQSQDADVLLLQQLQLARSVSFPGTAFHCVPTSPGRPTGNAVIVRADRLDPVKVEIAGALVAAAKARRVGGDFILVSAHVMTGERQQETLANFVAWVSSTVAGNRFVVGATSTLRCTGPSTANGSSSLCGSRDSRTADRTRKRFGAIGAAVPRRPYKMTTCSSTRSPSLAQTVDHGQSCRPRTTTDGATTAPSSWRSSTEATLQGDRRAAGRCALATGPRHDDSSRVLSGNRKWAGTT